MQHTLGDNTSTRNFTYNFLFLPVLGLFIYFHLF